MRAPNAGLALLLLGAAGCWNGEAAVGEACEEKQECASGLCLQESRYGEATGWSEGYCTRGCAGECGNSEVCATLEDGLFCLAACESDTDCRPGYLCHGGVDGCLPDCGLGFDCGQGSCGSDGLCDTPTDGIDAGTESAPSDTDTRGETGAPCLSTADCEDGFVCHQLRDSCVPDCRIGPPCPEGTTCSPRGACVDNSGPGPGPLV